MPDFRIPIRDIEFVIKELLGFTSHYSQLKGLEALPDDMMSAILQEAAKFCEKRLVPINRIGDEVGCRWQDGEVITPPGFKEAFQEFAEGGWISLAEAPEWGGQGLPFSLFMVVFEMLSSSNMAWSLYIANYYGAFVTLGKYGTESQKATYMPPLVSGEWNATMCLTEPHCGSDLGLLRTKAVPNSDGSYAIHGTKIFITSGEHDFNDNIVHLVLARLPEAPAGTKGISLFIVPKFNVNADGSLGERNAAVCGSIEEKMGIHGSATCSMNFDGARGYLLGEENKGLNAMFTYMNESRITTAIQGYALGESAFQGALAYAKERLQLRAPVRTHPQQPADPIISHPDVRRMLLTQKAFTEGGRMLTYYCLQLMDISLISDNKALKQRVDGLLGLLTPIAKGFNSETGMETTSLGVQVFGGHGYIVESGMEQFSRDQRITAIYEGTSGIQGMDLLGRKVLGMGLLEVFLGDVQVFFGRETGPAMAEFIAPLMDAIEQWQGVTTGIHERSKQDPHHVGSCAYDYLMYSGYVTLAYFWAQAAAAALQQIENGNEDQFYKTKLETARFYYRRLLPRAQTYIALLQERSDSLLAIDSEDFLF